MRLWCADCIKKAIVRGVEPSQLKFYEGGSDIKNRLYAGDGYDINRGVTIIGGRLLCWECM